MSAMMVLRGAAVVRVGIGVALALRTRQLLKAMLGSEEPSASFVLFARTVGIRDAFFGLGCLLASLSDMHSSETRRWVQLWMANEVADVVAAVTASRRLGPANAGAAAVPPLAFIAADAWVLRRLGTPSNRTALTS